jgi:hypothetical protein
MTPYENCSFFDSFRQVYSFMLIVAFGLAYFYPLTSPILENYHRINETSLSQKNKKSILASSKKLTCWIKSYNLNVMEELEISAMQIGA